MKLIADLHIHSHFSIATSKQLVPEYLDLWARIKGINIVGTGDFTHPSWIDELEGKLEPAEEGLYRLRDELRISGDWGLAPGFGNPVRFLLSAEISSIYKKRGKVRKVHNVVLSPDFETVRRIQAGLARRKFNITSDGRPILGMDSRDLLELILEISDRAFFIPAHIWTPWFSALGAKSGFDSIEECYEDMAPYIHAVETGLSSDPAMNWMCGFLDRYTLVSNSDAHSPEKLGREANILEADLSYSAVTGAIASGEESEFKGTIEFFPQEGKYHYDGHRKCGICWDPLENLKNRGICASCGKPVTMGVMSRIAQLSDRSDINERKVRPPFYSIVPLKEIFSEIMGVGPSSKKVEAAYRNAIRRGGAEFRLLLEAGTDEMEAAGGPLLAEAIRRMRAGEVYIQEGYDGEFGVIKLFEKGEIEGPTKTGSLFKDGVTGGKKGPEPRLLRFSLKDYRDLDASLNPEQLAVSESVLRYVDSGGLFENLPGTGRNSRLDPQATEAVQGGGEENIRFVLNPEQQAAVNHGSGPCMVIAGPGTGKTQVLTRRVLHLVREDGVKPERILAVTFTNKAAGEISKRITRALGRASGFPEVTTFHALGYKIIKRNLTEAGRSKGALLIDADDQQEILSEILGCGKNRAKRTREAISRFKQEASEYIGIKDPEMREAAETYNKWLKLNNLFDLDDLIVEAVRLLGDNSDIRVYWQGRFERVLVDEFQDINHVQYQLLRLLCPDPDSQICVIGDPDQAIYGFRGSDSSYMKVFNRDYPSSRVYSLKQSYRCTNTILQASSGVLRREDYGNDPLQGLIQGRRLKISVQATGRSEAEFVARTIEEMVGGLRSFSMYSRISAGEEAESIGSLSDFAVLCRTGRQMDLFEEAFDNHAVPFQRVGEGSFLDAPVVRDVLGLLRFLRNPDNSFLEKRLKGKSSNAIGSMKGKQIPEGNVRDALQGILAAAGAGYLEEHAVLQLLDFSRDFGEDFEGFYRFLELGSGEELYRKGSESVALMTIHASKGLEFECVFIPGCEDGILPCTFFNREDVDLAEERRLFYVAMTRARQYLFLTHARTRFIFGKKFDQTRSPFLESIETRLLEELKTERKKKEEKPEDRQLRLF
jgi:uncharacterized protein (TIGR00375 family)